jgi:hypothetical protein
LIYGPVTEMILIVHLVTQ